MAVLADPGLKHQVRITNSKNKIRVSCNCRATVPLHSKAGRVFYLPMGESKTLDQARSLYNDPENHWAPFSKEDEAKW